jgi:hypothetical protein
MISILACSRPFPFCPLQSLGLEVPAVNKPGTACSYVPPTPEGELGIVLLFLDPALLYL